LVDAGINAQRAADAALTTSTETAPERQIGGLWDGALGTPGHQLLDTALKLKEQAGPTFDDIRELVIALWEQQRSLLREHDNDVYDANTFAAQIERPPTTEHDDHSLTESEEKKTKLAEQEEKERRDQTASSQRLALRAKRKRNVVLGVLVFFVGGAVSGKVLGPRLVGRVYQPPTPLLLAVKDVPKV
jgi:hypothetical protein